MNLTCSPSHTNHMTLLCGATIGPNGRKMGEQRPIQQVAMTLGHSGRRHGFSSVDSDVGTQRRDARLVPAGRYVHTGFSTSSKRDRMGREPAAAPIDAFLAAHGLPHRDERRLAGRDPAPHEGTSLVDLFGEHVEQCRPIRPYEPVRVGHHRAGACRGRVRRDRCAPRPRRPRSGRTSREARDVVDATAGRGEVEVQQRDRDSIPVHDVLGTDVVVTDDDVADRIRIAASRRSRSHPAGAAKPTVASWKRRNSDAVDASTASVCDQAGNGGTGTSPTTNTRRSRPSASMPTTSGAASNPTARTCRSNAWIVGECGLVGRSTCGPTRTTAPALPTPPWSTSGSSFTGRRRRRGNRGRAGPPASPRCLRPARGDSRTRRSTRRTR